MVDPHILPEPEHTDRVAPARVLSVENAGIHELGLCQLQSHLCQADRHEFRPLRVLDSHSPGMAIFNMIRALFCEAAISHVRISVQYMSSKCAQTDGRLVLFSSLTPYNIRGLHSTVQWKVNPSQVLFFIFESGATCEVSAGRSF